MILDFEPQVIWATGEDALIMETCQQPRWLRFWDLRDASYNGISDFRTFKQLDEFAPRFTVSQFMKTTERGRLASIRTHRKNLKRMTDPHFKAAWEHMGYHDRTLGQYSIDHSKEHLAKFKKMKLTCVMMTLHGDKGKRKNYNNFLLDS